MYWMLPDHYGNRVHARAETEGRAGMSSDTSCKTAPVQWSRIKELKLGTSNGTLPVYGSVWAGTDHGGWTEAGPTGVI